jgi:hypothetical protein
MPTASTRYSRRELARSGRSLSIKYMKFSYILQVRSDRSGFQRPFFVTDSRPVTVAMEAADTERRREGGVVKFYIRADPRSRNYTRFAG